MNRETLKTFEQCKNKRVRGIANLAKVWDMGYRETEKLVDAMKEQLEDPDDILKQYEAAMDAEFNVRR